MMRNPVSRRECQRKQNMTAFFRYLLWLVALTIPGWAIAQDGPWPNRPVKIIVPLGPGSAADNTARAVADLLAKQLGQSFVIENRAGAGGTLGSALVAQAKPDGYTLMVHSNSHTVSAATYKQLSYDPARDRVGVASLALTPLVFVTSTAGGLQNLQDLVTRAKAKPGLINYATAGIGTATHLGAERLRIAGGFTATQVPMKSTAEALTEVLSGRADFFLGPIGLSSQHMKSGRLIALAVSSTKRSSAIPNVPTTGEAGVANAEYESWMGMFAPAGTPRAIIDRLNAEVAKALRTAEVQTRYDALVMSPLIMAPDEFAAFLKKDFEMNAQLVKQVGLTPN